MCYNSQICELIMKISEKYNENSKKDFFCHKPILRRKRTLSLKKPSIMVCYQVILLLQNTTLIQTQRESLMPTYCFPGKFLREKNPHNLKVFLPQYSNLISNRFVHPFVFCDLDLYYNNPTMYFFCLSF